MRPKNINIQFMAHKRIFSFTFLTENLQTSEFIMPMQSLPQQHASRSNTTQSNMLPNSSFNPSLPTEPLPYEETLEIQKCVMDVTSPNEEGFRL